MTALCLTFADQADAKAKAVELSDGWDVCITGPMDGCEIRHDGKYITTVAGRWCVFASLNELSPPPA